MKNKFIIKRDGRKESFNRDKIVNAIKKAFIQVDGEFTDYAKQKANNIADYIEKVEEEKELTIKEIQTLVENGLCSLKDKKYARAFIEYRHDRDLARESTLDEDALSLVKGENDYLNTENSNKRAEIVTTQRDYLAGLLSEHLAKKYIFPKNIVEDHNKGAIHVHDLQYSAQETLTNCFRGDTKFISLDGVRPFCSYKDGDHVFVPTHTGEWKKAIVRFYGVKAVNKVVLKRGQWTTKTFYVTKNHRWLLRDGSITTNLSVGDYLIKTPKICEFEWEDLTKEEKQYWCKGFAYGDGRTVQLANGPYTEIRLCGRKNKYIQYFKDAGYNVTHPADLDGDASAKLPGFDKNYIPDNMTVDETKIFAYGYLCADGHRTVGTGSSSKNEFKAIQVTGAKKCEEVYHLLNKAGYYVSSEKDLTDQVTNYGPRTDVTIHFQFQADQSYRDWRVIDIQENVQDCGVWCLEVEDNHSFILEGGIVTGNCELINLNDMLQNGTVINGVLIEKPHRLITAMTIATQIIAAVTSATFGGCTITFTHLAPFVRSSYEIYKKKYRDIGLNDKQVEELAKKDLRKEIEDAIQTMNYQLNSFTNTNGQSPFCSICIYLNENPEYKEEVALLAEETFKQRIDGMKNPQGVPVTQAFPKLLMVLDESTCDETRPYWWLTELAAKCSAKRMVPDYISEKIMIQNKGGCWPCMGCRSSLTPDRFTKKYGNLERAKDYDGKPKYYGRANIGVCTVNIPYAALLAKEQHKDFYEVLDYYLEECHKVQKIRAERLSKTKAKCNPICWMYGAMSRLDPEDTLYDLVHHGVFTSSIGYVGIWEATEVITGRSHTTPEGMKFAKELMQHLNDKCNEWKQEEDIDYSLYGKVVPLCKVTYIEKLQY